MDAGLRRHDKPSLRLKAREFNHPPKGRLNFNFSAGIKQGAPSGRARFCFGCKSIPASCAAVFTTLELPRARRAPLLSLAI